MTDNYFVSLAKSYWSDDGAFVGCLLCSENCPHDVQILEDGSWEASYHDTVITIPHDPLGPYASCLYSLSGRTKNLTPNEVKFWSQVAYLYREIPLWMLEAKYGAWAEDFSEDECWGKDDWDNYDDFGYDDFCDYYGEEDEGSEEKDSYISIFTGKEN